MSDQQSKKFHHPDDVPSFKNLSLTSPLNERLDEDDQLFLRTDLNQLFGNMMISSNFNFKKYSQSKQHQTKKNSKRQSVQLQFQKSHQQNRPKKMITEPGEANAANENVFLKTKKNETAIEWNINHQPKKQFLKTDNLNRLLKKKDSASFTNGNKEIFGSKSVKVNAPVASTYVSKQQQNDSQFISTKYIPSSKSKNVRRKMMSFTSKGNRVIRVQTETNRDDSKSFVKTKQSNKRVQTENPVIELPNQKKNNYNDLQKKYNKGGPLKFRHVQNWLNNIIQEYCHDEYFDTSLTSAALKKYYIDSNSLMSNGVDPADVNRIYNSLFVYSIGFNNLIKQISKGNRQLVKNIWKVYSLLLEYCAAGNYETLVGQIQRDKLRKVEELKMEIQKRQQIIQKNQQLNEHKNMTMFKQLKRLKDQNFNLANERQILMEDFQQADQAFNEEVSLRLKFQNTINEIYGVHKELQNKHGRLFHDFQSKMQELKRSSDKYFEQTKISQKYKYDLIDLKQKHNELMKINNHDKEHIDVLLQQLSKMKDEYFLNLKELEQIKYISIEKDRKLQQMQTQLENNKLILQLREKSAKQTHTQYRITLEENNKLFAVISDQRLQMEGLLKQKKEFNQNVLKILADSTYYKKKHQAAEIQLKNLNQKLIQAETNLHKTEVQSDIFIKELDICKNDLQSNYENIKKMHTRNFELEEELTYLRKFQGNMDSVIQEKNALILQLKNKVQDLEKKLMQETHDFMNLESKYKILDAQFRAEKELTLRRVDEFRKEQQLMCTNESSLSKLLNATNNELDRFKTMWNNTLMDLKNEKFERSNLTLTYEQILKVVEKKNAQEKQAAIKINQLQEEVLEYKEKYKRTHLNLINTTQDLTLKITHHKQTIADQKQILNHKAHHYHPMLYEDLVHTYQLQLEAHQKTKQNYSKRLQTSFKERTQLQKSLKRQKGQLQYKIDKMETEFKKTQQKLQGQLEYMKDENDKIKKRLSGLEMLQAAYKEKVKVFESREEDDKRMNQLLQEINQKNVKISSLYEEIEKIHDLKRDQITGLRQQVKKVQDQKINFIYEYKQKKQREIHQELQKKYQEMIESIKVEYEQKLKSPSYRMNSSKSKRISQQDLPDQNQDFNSYFKELVKEKTLQELLQIKRQQLQSMNEPENNKFFDQVENFFKQSAISHNQEFFNRTNYFTSQKNSTQKDFAKSNNKNSKDRPLYLQRLQNDDMRRRAAITRKLKIAHDYYNKN